jgi:hypothetical protein
MVRFSDARYWHKIESENRPLFSFQMVTVYPRLIRSSIWYMFFEKKLKIDLNQKLNIQISQNFQKYKMFSSSCVSICFPVFNRGFWSIPIKRSQCWNWVWQYNTSNHLIPGRPLNSNGQTKAEVSNGVVHLNISWNTWTIWNPGALACILKVDSGAASY